MATNVAFLLLLLLVAFRCALAQPSPDDYDMRYHRYNTNFSPGIAVLIVFLAAFLFVIVFFSLYISRRSAVQAVVAPVPTALAAAARGGLDPTIIETFPTLAYSEVVRLRTDKGPLECAVCLCEFEDDESLRMLPRCCHVFHPECIDAWLAGHKTCPVCRADLSVAAVDAAKEIPAADVAIDLLKIGRSNTIAVADRFTLRLPEHVRREIVMKRSASLAVAFPAKGESSSRSGYRRGRSDRWGSLVRTLSIWRTGDGEGTSSDSKKERIFDFLAGHKRRSSSKDGSGDQPSSSASQPDAHV